MTNRSTDAELVAFDTRLHLAIARASHNRFPVEAIERILAHRRRDEISGRSLAPGRS